MGTVNLDDTDIPHFKWTRLYQGDLEFELTIGCRGKRFQVYFEEESIRGPHGDETLVNELLNFKKTMRRNRKTFNACIKWMVMPCMSHIKQLAPPPPPQQNLSLASYLDPETFTFRLTNVEGRFEATMESAGVFGYPPRMPMTESEVSKAISQGVPCIAASVLAPVVEGEAKAMGFGNGPRKVQHSGNATQYHFKPALAEHEQRAFKRELNALLDIKSKFPDDDLRVSKIAGVVTWADGLSVAGLVVEYIDGDRTLGDVRDNTPKEDREKWARQVRETVERLHEADIVWGDIHEGNVLIDNNDDAWVIDFGGSYVSGWIDGDKAETKEGDMQGLSRLDKYLKIGDADEETNCGNSSNNTKAAQNADSQSEGRHSPVDSGIDVELDVADKAPQTRPNTNEHLDIKAAQDAATGVASSSSSSDSGIAGQSQVTEEDLQARCDTDAHPGINLPRDALHDADSNGHSDIKAAQDAGQEAAASDKSANAPSCPNREAVKEDDPH